MQATTNNDSNLKNQLSDLSDKFAQNLKMVHLNAQSLNDKTHFDEFCHLFSSSNIDLTAVSETFFKDSSKTVVNNYNIFHANRTNRLGGGVAIYVKDSIPAKLIFQSDSDGFVPEYVGIEIKCLSEKILVVCMYRPPDIGYVDLFVNELYNYLPHYKYVLLCGDLNARFGSGSGETAIIEEMLDLCNIDNIPYTSTYYTSHSESILDVIGSNFNDKLINFGQTGAPAFSRHDLLYAVFDIRTPRNVRKSITYRDYRNVRIGELTEAADRCKWHRIIGTDNIDEKVSIFTAILLDLLNKYVPLKTIMIKKEHCPWMTDEVLEFIDKRDKAWRRFKKNKTEENNKIFVDLRNNAKQEIRNAKLRYDRQLFRNKSSKEIWKGIRAMGVKTKNDKTTGSSDYPVTADELNSHYLSVSSINNPDCVNKMIDKYKSMFRHCKDKMYFTHVYPDQIKKVLFSIKSNSVGEDGIPVRFLKLCIDSILPVLEHIVNFSLERGVFPTMWKMSRVKPIAKIKKPKECKDLRPVSILCVLSKMVEKIVHGQIIEYIEEKNIMNPLQSGFVKGHSTATALLRVTDDIRKSIDDREVNLLVLLDFSKAFDRVHHELLIVKLRNMGFSEIVLSWIKEYISERWQRVMDGEYFCSKWATLLTSVPQGSVLGPLLFALYINDISDCLNFCKYHLYADDLQLYFPFKINEYENAISSINSDLLSIINYSHGHNLMLNAEKTQPIFVGSNNYIKRLADAGVNEIRVNDIIIPFCTSVKNLGVTFDRTLSWDLHIRNVTKRVFQTLAQIRRLFNVMPKETRRMVVESLIMPIFDYCNVLFTNMSSLSTTKLQRAQNACIKFITGGRKSDHVTPLYKELKMLKLNERRIMAQSILLWKVIKFKRPNYLFNSFIQMSQVHPRDNRHTHNLMQIPLHRTELFSKSFLVTSIKIWNEFKLSQFQEFTTCASLKKYMGNELTY